MNKKVCLVTGAARGIGKEIAIMFAKENYDVIINYNGSEDAAKKVFEECQKLGSNSMLIKANIADFNETDEMIQKIIQKYEHLDVLVNNSGITKDNLMLRMSDADFNSVIDINLKGTFNVIKHASKVMMKQRSGVIINMASVIGKIGNIGQANYAASKAGVIGLTKSCAKEFAPRNIRVNAIAPGFISTKMTDVLDDKIKENILNNIPLKTFGSTEDVANLAIFLASDKSKYITGQVINVDGGMVM